MIKPTKVDNGFLLYKFTCTSWTNNW